MAPARVLVGVALLCGTARAVTQFPAPIDGTGEQPGVYPTDYAHSDWYRSDFCKQPIVKYNPPDHQYLLWSKPEYAFRRPQLPAVAVAAPKGGPVAGPGNVSTAPASRQLLGIRGRAKRAAARVSKKKGGDGMKVRIPGWERGHPKHTDYAVIKHSVDNADKFCPFEVKECMRPGVKGRRVVSVKGQGHPCCSGKDTSCCRLRKNYKAEAEPITQEQWERLPSVPKGHWGSCAYVALGDNLLRSERGAEIDAHDVVMRLGHAPVKGYEKHVGSRTDIAFSRGASTRMSAALGYRDTKFYIGSAPANLNSSVLRPSGVDYPPLEPLDTSGENISPRYMAMILYNNMAGSLAGKPRGPTSGYLTLLNLAFSGFCKRMDLYGMSSNGGAVYYIPQGERMKIHHSCELESWSLHHLMKEHSDEIHMCVNV